MLLPLFKSLADATRLRLLHLLAHGEFTVQELTAILGMGQSRISRHLKILHDAGLLAVSRQGTWSYYRIAPQPGWTASFWQLLKPALASLDQGPADLRQMAKLCEERQRADREFFDRHARQWDVMKQAALQLPPYRERLLQLLGGGEKLVEIGVGTGGLLPVLAETWQEVVGIDHSRAMLDEATGQCRGIAAARIELRLGEMSHLPLPDAAADAVLMNMVLHHAPRPQQVLEEVARVLRPGGRLLIADLVRHQQDWTRELLADLWLGFAAEELQGWLCAAEFSETTNELIAAEPPQHGVLLVTARKPLTTRS